MTWPRFAFAFLAVAACLSGCGSPSAQEGGSSNPSASGGAPTKTKGPVKELVKKDTTIGTGLTVEDGDVAEMEYTGTLADGTVFDTNGPTRENSKPFRFVVGNGSVIKGWDLGVVGMKVGGTRELEIPSQLGYGSKDQGKIPPNSDLFFTVKLLAVVKKGQDAVYDPPKDTKMGTGPAVKDGDWVTIEYKSEYMNGAEFASSPDGKPLEFQTITGLTRSGDKMGVTGLLYCLRGMKEGGTREIVLPPSIAYTLAQMDNERNPSNLTLKYTVHLLKVKPGTLPKSAKKS